MRRTKSILAVSDTMVMMLAATAGPALAADNDHHDNRVDNRLDYRMDRLDNTPLVGGLFKEGTVLGSGLISDFDHGFVGDIHDIDNGFFIVDNGHSFVDMHR